jgi:ABC-2 type transport system permease protein
LRVYRQATRITSDVANAPIAVVDSDRSALSARFHDGLLKPCFSFPDAIDRSVVDRTMDSGARAFVLDMPPRLAADLLRGCNPTLQLNIDATAMTQAAMWRRSCDRKRQAL